MELSKELLDELNKRKKRLKENIEEVFALNENVTKKILGKNSDDLRKLKQQLLVLNVEAIEYVRDFSQSAINPEKVLELSQKGNLEDLVSEAKIKITLQKVYDDLIWVLSVKRFLQANKKDIEGR